ncbi:MAG: hydrolase [Armatimonadota bacterium]
MKMQSAQILDRQRTTLVVVDMQDVFLSQIKVRRLIEDNVKLLMQVAFTLDIPIVATTQNGSKLGGVIPALLDIGSIPIYDKLCFSCWQEENFAHFLQETERPQVLLTGIEGHICILQTAVDLINAGYAVHVPCDAVASRNKRDWKYALYRLQRAGAIVTSTESAIYEWLREAGTDSFRQVLSLLKQKQESKSSDSGEED